MHSDLIHIHFMIFNTSWEPASHLPTLLMKRASGNDWGEGTSNKEGGRGRQEWPYIREKDAHWETDKVGGLSEEAQTKRSVRLGYWSTVRLVVS